MNPALGRQKCKELKFQASLGYRSRPCLKKSIHSGLRCRCGLVAELLPTLLEAQPSWALQVEAFW
jgi:hypothetical protein